MKRMKSLTQRIMVAFGATVLVMAAAANGYANDACKNVKFQIKNQRAVTIRIFKVEYLNKANNKVQTEDIQNIEVAPGHTVTTNGDNLRDSEGENLTNFVFFFNDREADGQWSRNDIHTQNKLPVTQQCSADKTYKGSPVWTIN